MSHFLIKDNGYVQSAEWWTFLFLFALKQTYFFKIVITAAWEDSEWEQMKVFLSPCICINEQAFALFIYTHMLSLSFSLTHAHTHTRMLIITHHLSFVVNNSSVPLSFNSWELLSLSTNTERINETPPLFFSFRILVFFLSLLLSFFLFHSLSLFLSQWPILVLSFILDGVFSFSYPLMYSFFSFSHS